MVERMQRHLLKSKLQIILIVFVILVLPVPSLPQTSVNVNLDSWVYGVVERLASVGLIESDLMNTRPLTRLEVARLTGEAMGLAAERRHGNEPDELTLYLLERLKKSFRDELSSLGIIDDVRAETFIKPVDEIRIRYHLLDRNHAVYNNDGIRYGDDHNLSLEFSGYSKFSDTLSLYYQPIFEYNQNLDTEERTEFDLRRGYVKLTRSNIEFQIGRDSLWWGPGYHGSLLVTNNAKPFDMMKVSNPRPVLLPWLFRYLGPFRATWFLTKLEKDRVIPEPYLTGLRLDLKPLPILEMGISRTVMFGGTGREQLGFGDYVTMFFASQENESDPGKGNNQIASLDFSLRIPGVERFLPISRGIRVYGEYGGEDEAGGFFSHEGYVAGVLLEDIFLKEGTNLRIEYANNHVGTASNVWYNHDIYQSGYTYKNSIIGHHMGSDAEDIFIRATSYLTESSIIGIDLDIEERGKSFAFPEKHYQMGIDLSYNFTDRMEIKGRYGYERVEDFGFADGEKRNYHLVGLEFQVRF
ncbi:MAG: capsule assembly Wzi family protein [Pseudomonadota bacterium]